MKYLIWNKKKNEELKKRRNISFEVVSHLIETKQVLNIIKHPNEDKYPNQRIFVVEYHNYVYLVPFVEDDEHIFLKTIIPSRKATKKYLKGDNHG
ncbi:MAG: toxin [Candidatus Lokiarchaeota archaeon]|nr:toxin [Candidatus Lokiarchaeota archaeon]